MFNETRFDGQWHDGRKNENCGWVLVMESMDPLFLQFCEQIGVEPNDERYLFWLAGRRNDDPPAVFACIDQDGHVFALLDAIPLGMRPAAVPLYRRPVGAHPAPLDPRIIQYVWRNFNGDIEGYTRWLEQYCRNGQGGNPK